MVTMSNYLQKLNNEINDIDKNIKKYVKRIKHIMEKICENNNNINYEYIGVYNNSIMHISQNINTELCKYYTLVEKRNELRTLLKQTEIELLIIKRNENENR